VPVHDKADAAGLGGEIGKVPDPRYEVGPEGVAAVLMSRTRWIVLVEDLEYLGPSVGLERVPGVFGKTERIARPSSPG
jgi:hypothetical protein